MLLILFADSPPSKHSSTFCTLTLSYTIPETKGICRESSFSLPEMECTGRLTGLASGEHYMLYLFICWERLCRTQAMKLWLAIRKCSLHEITLHPPIAGSRGGIACTHAHRPLARGAQLTRNLVRVSQRKKAWRPAATADRSVNGANSVVEQNITSSSHPEPVRVFVTNEVAVKSIVPPAELYQRVVEAGVYKGTQPWWKIVVGGVLAGVYTAMGGIFLLTVGPNCLQIAADNPGLAKLITGTIGLPIGLITIFTCGGDLFTGNTAVVTAALLEKRVTISQLLKSWICSYFANMLGCALGIGLAFAGGLMPQLSRGATAYAVFKTSAPLSVVLARAIGANWFVCLAVWQCTAAQTYVGKALACTMPLAAFITIGLEHSVANMFFVPLGILAGQGLLCVCRLMHYCFSLQNTCFNFNHPRSQHISEDICAEEPSARDSGKHLCGQYLRGNSLLPSVWASGASAQWEDLIVVEKRVLLSTRAPR